MWYAIKDNGEVIAQAETYSECSTLALEAMPDWIKQDGVVAPYYLTTIEPKGE